MSHVPMATAMRSPSTTAPFLGASYSHEASAAASMMMEQRAKRQRTGKISDETLIESPLLRRCLHFEHELDQLLNARHASLVESLHSRPRRCEAVLRISLYNTYQNQESCYHLSPALEETARIIDAPPCWTLYIEGAMQDMATRASQPGSPTTFTTTPLISSPLPPSRQIPDRRFSSFFSRVQIELLPPEDDDSTVDNDGGDLVTKTKKNKPPNKTSDDPPISRRSSRLSSSSSSSSSNLSSSSSSSSSSNLSPPPLSPPQSTPDSPPPGSPDSCVHPDTEVIDWLEQSRGLYSSAAASAAGAAATPTTTTTTTTASASAAAASKDDDDAEFDGFEIKRLGDRERTVKVYLYPHASPPRFQVTHPRLAALLGVDADTKARVLLSLWHYVKTRSLQKSDDPSTIVCDEALAQIFGADELSLLSLPERLEPFFGPLAPIELSHRIRLSGDPLRNASVFDVTLDVPAADPVAQNVPSREYRRKLHELETVQDGIFDMLENSRRRYQMFAALHESPVAFIAELMNSQIRDYLLARSDDGKSLEAERASNCYFHPYTADAIDSYLQALKH